MLQRTLPAGFIAPCLPTKTDKLPIGRKWLHEIKHDGFRVIARKDGNRIRLYSRPCNDLANAPRRPGRLPPTSSTRLRGVMTRKASCVRQPCERIFPGFQYPLPGHN
jgi:hypothetical protein